MYNKEIIYFLCVLVFSTTLSTASITCYIRHDWTVVFIIVHSCLFIILRHCNVVVHPIRDVTVCNNIENIESTVTTQVGCRNINQLRRQSKPN